MTHYSVTLKWITAASVTLATVFTLGCVAPMHLRLMIPGMLDFEYAAGNGAAPPARDEEPRDLRARAASHGR